MPDLERILVNTPATLQQQWYEDGAVVDPGTVTVTITRWDGTALVTGGATSGTGTNPRTFNLTTTHTALLDRLTVTWTSTSKGTQTSYAEVVGGFLFSLAQARSVDALSKKDNSGNYRIATADIVATRTLVEEALEDACGVAFVPRYTLETINRPHGSALLRPRVRTIRSLTVNATVYTADQIAALNVDALDGVLSLSAHRDPWFWDTWPSWTSALTIGYEHGYDTPPARITRAALLLAKRWLAGTPADDRATSVSTAEETTTLYVPNAGDLFDVPDVIQAVQQYSVQVGVA